MERLERREFTGVMLNEERGVQRPPANGGRNGKTPERNASSKLPIGAKFAPLSPSSSPSSPSATLELLQSFRPHPSPHLARNKTRMNHASNRTNERTLCMYTCRECVLCSRGLGLWPLPRVAWRWAARQSRLRPMGWRRAAVPPPHQEENEAKLETNRLTIIKVKQLTRLWRD